MRPAIVQISFAEVSYINYNTTVYGNFDIITLLDIESIIMILDIILAGKGDKLSTAPYKILPYLFLAPIKGEGKCLKPID